MTITHATTMRTVTTSRPPATPRAPAMPATAMPAADATELAPTATYAAAYAKLSEIAQRLRGPAAATSIDSLAADVRAARASFAVCKARLDAIRTEIEVEITAIEADGATAPPPA